MKWHKFLIYCVLWLSGAINAVTAVMYLLGAQYMGKAAEAYAINPLLHAIDIGMALALAGLAMFSVMTRFSLAKFEAVAPKMLMCLYVCNVLSSLVYQIAVSAAVGRLLLNSDTISSVFTGAVMILLNKVYYDKRADLFIN